MGSRTARIVVQGRVQGVGYRWFARDAALGLALSGWVRNRRDGSVELEAGGDEATLATLCARLKAGPPAARVTSVDIEWLPASPAAPAAQGEPAAAAPHFDIRPTA